MTFLIKEIKYNPLLWLLALVPVVLAIRTIKPEAHTLLFLLSVAAIVPLAALLSRATEVVAAKTGDTIASSSVTSRANNVDGNSWPTMASIFAMPRA